MADGNLYYARNVEFAAIGWRNFMGAVGSALHLDRHRPKMASACIEDPRFVSTHIDIHSDAIGQIVPALKEILLIVFHPVTGGSKLLLRKCGERQGRLSPLSRYWSTLHADTRPARGECDTAPAHRVVRISA